MASHCDTRRKEQDISSTAWGRTLATIPASALGGRILFSKLAGFQMPSEIRYAHPKVPRNATTNLTRLRTVRRVRVTSRRGGSSLLLGHMHVQKRAFTPLPLGLILRFSGNYTEHQISSCGRYERRGRFLC